METSNRYWNVFAALALIAVVGLLLPGQLGIEERGLTGPAAAQSENNTAPELFNGWYTSIEGEWNSYAFYVGYRDMDNDAPAYVHVIIDNSTYAMQVLTSSTATGNLSGYPAAYDGDYTNTEAYYFKITNLTRGDHRFRFAASDGQAQAVAGDTHVPITTPLLMSAEGMEKEKAESSTPGFELTIMIGALVLVFFYLNRRN